jgi:membrane-bound lytic murein transglycosylase B
VETQCIDKKELLENLRQEWKTMWRSRFDDKVRAEGIADKTYERLFVDRGLVLFATRGFKPPEFHEILRKYLTPEEVERFNPSSIRGGIRKFIREYITVFNKIGAKRVEETRAELENLKSYQQLKHGGRGWMHFSMSKN